MRILCLGYYSPEVFDRMSDEERQALQKRCRPHDEAFFGTGAIISVASLQEGGGGQDRGPAAASLTENERERAVLLAGAEEARPA